MHATVSRDSFGHHSSTRDTALRAQLHCLPAAARSRLDRCTVRLPSRRPSTTQRKFTIYQQLYPYPCQIRANAVPSPKRSVNASTCTSGGSSLNRTRHDRFITNIAKRGRGTVTHRNNQCSKPRVPSSVSHIVLAAIVTIVAQSRLRAIAL